MAGIELAIAEGPLAIFPRFPPMDRTKSDPKKGGFCLMAGGQGVWAAAPLLEGMFSAQIMIKAVFEAGYVARNEIGFGWVKIAARRIAAQSPTVGAILLPRGNAEGKL